ncbi:hypothetical protein BJ875DRAFT_511628, partial [Amylocarpus encephaloides]
LESKGLTDLIFPEFVPRASNLLAQSFTDNPLFTYILSPRDLESRASFLPKYFQTLLKAVTLNDGLIVEADGWKACGVLMRPGCCDFSLWTKWRAGTAGLLWGVGMQGCMKVNKEINPLTMQCREDILNSQQYYYLYQIGTLPSARGQGLCSCILKHFKGMVIREGLGYPIWLEATSEAGKQVYEKAGWKVIGEVMIGKGKSDDSGNDEEGGEGFKVWGM